MIPPAFALAFLQYNEYRQALVKLERCWHEWKAQNLSTLCVPADMTDLRTKMETARAALVASMTGVEDYILVYLLALSAYGTVNSTLQKS